MSTLIQVDLINVFNIENKNMKSEYNSLMLELRNIVF